jgi:hypothetical protein
LPLHGAVVSPQRSLAKGTNWLDEKLKEGFSLIRIRFIIATESVDLLDRRRALIRSFMPRRAESNIGREDMEETEIQPEFRFVHIVGESNALRTGPDGIGMVVSADRSC